MAESWGVAMAMLAAVAWGGQAISLVSPSTAERLGLTEPESEVDPAFYADVRGEALWDTLTLWVLVPAGVLLAWGSPAWAYFGLAGGAVYLYFAGRGVFTRRSLQRHRHRIGTDRNVRGAYLMLAVWGVMAAVTIVAAVVALES